VFDEMPESNISVDVYQSICYATMFRFLSFSIYGMHKSISSSGAKLARWKTPNQRAVEVLRAPFSSGHSQKL
jgi:hypothetical protein